MTRRSRGISLVEALIALAVMALGMLGLAGMQSTLRSNSDTAKQRAEALRFAQQGIEQWRVMAAMDTATDPDSYQRIATDPAVATLVGTNATYQRMRTVVDLDPTAGVPMLETLPRAKSVLVTVTWTDRNNEAQSVALTTTIAGVTPELASTLAVPADSPTSRPGGRNRNIPLQAIDLGDGRSAFLPPGASPGVVWVFNNSTALINFCSVLGVPSATNLPTCGTDYATLYAGLLRYSVAGPPSADNPASNRPFDLAPLAVPPLTVSIVTTAPFGTATIGCAIDNDTSGIGLYTAYYCAVPVFASGTPTVVNAGWSGSLLLGPTSLFGPPGPTLYKVCRYVSVTAAAQTDLRQALVNQNLLIISGSENCPGPSTAQLQP